MLFSEGCVVGILGKVKMKFLVVFSLVVVGGFGVFGDEDDINQRSAFLKSNDEVPPVKFPGKSESKYNPQPSALHQSPNPQNVAPISKDDQPEDYEDNLPSRPLPSYLVEPEKPHKAPSVWITNPISKNPHFNQLIQPQFPLTPNLPPIQPNVPKSPNSDFGYFQKPIQPNFPQPPFPEIDFRSTPRPQFPIQPNFPQNPHPQVIGHLPNRRPELYPPQKRPFKLGPRPQIQPNFPQIPINPVFPQKPIEPNFPQPPFVVTPQEQKPKPSLPPHVGPGGSRPPVLGGSEDEEFYHMMNAIPGVPGRDYPIYSVVPNTGFKCNPSYPGFYADVRSGCQVWHYCQLDGRQDDFLCPNGTLFNQKYFVCDWWYKVNCAASENFYPLNANLYQTPIKNNDHFLPPISAPRSKKYDNENKNV